MSDQAPSHADSKAAVDALDRFCVCLDKCTCLADWPVSFEKRVPQLRELCRTLWPHAMHDKTVFEPEIDHDLNLHYPVRLTYEGQEEEPKRVVIQIPYDDQSVEKYAQNLQYLDKFPEIRDLVPKVLQFDATRDNPLRRPYLVRSWVPGKPLTELYNKMTQEQKVLVAAELGRTWLRLEEVCGLYSGYPVPAKEGEKVDEDDEFAPQFKSMMKIRPFGLVEDQYKDKLDWDQIRDSITTQGEDKDKDKDQVLHRFNLLEDEPAMTARKILLLTFERRIQRNRHWALRKYENADLEPALEIVRDIVNKECNAASFPPTWLWTPGAVHDSENPKPETKDYPKDEEGNYKPKTEPLDLVMPVDDAGFTVKRAFDDAAGECFQTDAYNPDVVFARRYFAVACQQQWQICDGKELEYLAREWAGRKARCTCGRA
ncbi:hypothetical protein PG996_002662 [Apiospora saccharicola]|uniref:Aminoglycoside phosphotransferase domain-containing protein n=1 Tax=Apiospora saccharicola TaxID=335842 RepID=A0ABR1WK53_9PEZI